MKSFIIFSAILVFTMILPTSTAQTGGMNIGNLQANESIQVGTSSPSVVVLSDLVSLPPLTDSEILLIVDPVEGSIVYATKSDVLLVFNGMNWKRADGQNDSYLIINLPCVPFTDSRDGNSYNTVKIGAQCWMAENLKYLPSVVGSATGSETAPYYYVYDYNGSVVAEAKATANYSTYGVLYNWPAAMTGSASSNTNPSGVKGVCPTGWHLPSDAEWTEMENYLITNGYNYDGSITGNKIAKSLAATNWNSSSYTGAVGNTDYSTYRNKTGFTAFPGGYRYNSDGTFCHAGNDGFWWSATEDSSNSAYYLELYYSSDNVFRSYYDKSSGFSVRCTRD